MKRTPFRNFLLVLRLPYIAFTAFGLLFVSFASVAAIPTNTVIVRFADEKYFVSYKKGSLWNGLKPIFAELHSSDKYMQSLSSSSSLSAKLRCYAEIQIPANADISAFLRKIRAADGVEYADFAKTYRIQEQISNDSLVMRQWSLARIHVAEAWKASTGSGIIVGVLDTGVDFFHPDLIGQFAINAAEDINHNGSFEPWPVSEKRNGISGDLDGIDNDNNGFADDVIGYDFVDQAVVNIGDYAVRDPIPYDEHGHGTSVAGIIAAKTNNRIGIAGIASDARIKVLRCHDATGNAEEDDIAAAIVYAAMNGVRVLNMSFGDVINTPLTRDAVAFASAVGCVLVASAGNDGTDLRRFPASYPDVIAVAATTESDKRAPFSSFGSQLALSAPGVNIWTTAVGGKYRSFQGTSASAPHVSAAAALLLSSQPDLSPAEVRGILQAAAEDVGDKGWDMQFGAGILDCAAAVKAVGRTVVRIEYPQNDEVITSDSDINIRGTVLTPLLSSWVLDIATGENPSGDWKIIASDSNSANKASNLGLLELAVLRDSTYTLRLTARLRNGNSLESRVRFDMARLARKPQILSALAEPVWRDDVRAILLTAKTDRRSRCVIRSLSQNGKIYADNESFARRHEFVLTPEQAGNEVETMFYFPGSSDTSVARVTIPVVGSPFPTGGFSPKTYSAPAAQLSNYVRDFYRDGKPTFAINDISSGDFGDTKTIQFDGGKLTEKDKTAEKWIPRGLGDSNGDGVMEILAHSFADARLFQGKTTSDSPFTDTLFTEKTVSFAGRKEFFSAGMFDLDGDGREEIFGFSDTACLAYTYKNGKYELFAIAPNDSPRDAFGSPNAMRPPACFVDDLDGDGKKELFYGDTDGDFLVFEYSDGKFTREFLFESDGRGGTEFCTPLDVDGDGKKELLIGYYSRQEFTDDREYEPPIWTFRLLKSDAPNSYKTIWQDNFYGVRVGTAYANGVAAGDLDGVPGDEIALFPFPNVYVMRWDKVASAFQPLWYSPFQYSNTAIIYDFDANGIKELGYCDGSRTVFTEHISEGVGPGVPTGFTGYAKNARTAVLQWTAAPFATDYRLFAIRNPTSGTTNADFIASTSETSIILDTLTPNTLYRFYLRGKRLGSVQPDGAFTLPVDIFTHDPIRPISAQWHNDAVFVRFSAGYLPSRPIEERVFRLKTDKNDIPAEYAHYAGDSTVVVRFAKPISDGTWQLEIASFADRFGTLSEPAELDVKVENVPNKREMILLHLDIENSRTLRLLYSEPVKSGKGAAVLANYEFRPAGTVESVEVASDSTIILRLASPLYPIGKEYTLTVRNVASSDGIPITHGAGNTLGFILFGDDENSPYCYPNPFHIATDNEIVFSGLPHQAEITVYSLDMKPIVSLRDAHDVGGIAWKPVNSDGDPLPTGVYFFKVKGRYSGNVSIETNLIKFGVIR